MSNLIETMIAVSCEHSDFVQSIFSTKKSPFKTVAGRDGATNFHSKFISMNHAIDMSRMLAAKSLPYFLKIDDGRTSSVVTREGRFEANGEYRQVESVTSRYHYYRDAI